MDKIEGKYTLPNGEVLEVHINVAVNTWRDGQWVRFDECSKEEFLNAMNEMEQKGPIVFEPSN